jgi:hypothetical protein
VVTILLNGEVAWAGNGDRCRSLYQELVSRWQDPTLWYSRPKTPDERLHRVDGSPTSYPVLNRFLFPVDPPSGPLRPLKPYFQLGAAGSYYKLQLISGVERNFENLLLPEDRTLNSFSRIAGSALVGYGLAEAGLDPNLLLDQWDDRRRILQTIRADYQLQPLALALREGVLTEKQAIASALVYRRAFAKTFQVISEFHGSRPETEVQELTNVLLNDAETRLLFADVLSKKPEQRQALMGLAVERLNSYLVIEAFLRKRPELAYLTADLIARETYERIIQNPDYKLLSEAVRAGRLDSDQFIFLVKQNIDRRISLEMNRLEK